MQLIILCIMFEAMGCSSLRVVRPLAFEMDVSLGSQLCGSGSEDFVHRLNFWYIHQKLSNYLEYQ